MLNAEHTHRYLWAARGARGRVLEAACGVGYGAPLLMSSKQVTRYTGLDRAQDALDYAQREYSGDNREFLFGDVYELPFDDATFDSIVSLETIEHLEHPGKALAEFARVLKPDGLMLGSVPDWEFEELCSKAYGSNEFHKSQFTLPALEALIKERFKHFSIWNCWLEIASILAPMYLPGSNREFSRIVADDKLFQPCLWKFATWGIKGNAAFIKHRQQR